MKQIDFEHLRDVMTAEKRRLKEDLDHGEMEWDEYKEGLDSITRILKETKPDKGD